jgi:hypothetical protein
MLLARNARQLYANIRTAFLSIIFILTFCMREQPTVARVLESIATIEGVVLCVIISESTTQLAGLMLPPEREWPARYK